MSLRRTARIAVATIGILFSNILIPAQAAAAADQPSGAGQLDALVAPVALYPDQLLAKVLIASTYPLEVAEADRWAEANKGLKGPALDQALAKQSWDESVKSLAYTPTVLKMMSDRLDWTQKLGDAFLSREKDVTDAVQRLRRKAQDHGTLKTTAQQTVTMENASDCQGEGGSSEQQCQVIAVEPTEPDTVYVPYYDAQSVYGDWAYPYYPPYYWPPPYGYRAAIGIAFILGAAIGSGWWNNGIGWGNGGVYVDHRNFNNFNRNNINNINRDNVRNGQRWNHQVDHRKGVGYGDSSLRQKYGRDSGRGAAGRQDFRGRNDANRVADSLGRNGVGIGNNGQFNNNGRGGNNSLGNRGGLDRSSYGSRGRGGGYDGIGRGGSTRQFSSRGAGSMRSGGFRGGGGMRGGGMRGGGGRRR
jgi:hypothetical protein